MKQDILITVEVDAEHPNLCDYNCEWLVPDESNKMVCSLFSDARVEIDSKYERCVECLEGLKLQLDVLKNRAQSTRIAQNIQREAYSLLNGGDHYHHTDSVVRDPVGGEVAEATVDVPAVVADVPQEFLPPDGPPPDNVVGRLWQDGDSGRIYISTGARGYVAVGESSPLLNPLPIPPTVSESTPTVSEVAFDISPHSLRIGTRSVNGQDPQVEDILQRIRNASCIIEFNVTTAMDTRGLRRFGEPYLQHILEGRKTTTVEIKFED